MRRKIKVEVDIEMNIIEEMDFLEDLNIVGEMNFLEDMGIVEDLNRVEGFQQDVAAQIREACTRVAPLWPLKDFVAVNPFVGLSALSFVDACDLMRRVTHGELAMSAAYYQERLDKGLLLDADLQSALDLAQHALPTSYAAMVACWTVETLKSALQPRQGKHADTTRLDRVLTVADLLDHQSPPVRKKRMEESQTHETSALGDSRSGGSLGWQAFIVDEISKWCSAYYDEGQASWRMPWRDAALFAAWKEVALRDANPEMMGLRGFRAFVATLPDEATEVIEAALRELQVAPASATDFLHRELMSIAGWSGYVQYRVRANGMSDRNDPIEEDALRQLLAIRLAYDVALYRQYESQEFRRHWEKCASFKPDTVLPVDLPALLTNHLWQLAAESAYQRKLLADLATTSTTTTMVSPRPAAQAVFCIDVRSEPFRRALESVAESGAGSSEVETLGFAGFFGFPIELVPFGYGIGHEKCRAQCPVLLKPAFRIRETLMGTSPEQEQAALQSLSFSQRLAHAWNAFKTSAVCCFSFVETGGLLSSVKLIKETLGLHHEERTPYPLAPAISIDEQNKSEVTEGDLSAPVGGMSLGEQIAVAANALHKMGLTTHFARLVLFCGHGSQTANNPYGAALDCGACGGHSGEVNARVAAAVLNSPPVRAGLAERGIVIPAETLFLAGLHNTTTDEVRLFDLASAPTTHREDIQRLEGWLTAASHRARLQRAALLRDGGLSSGLSGAEVDRRVQARSHDWAQTRPEWGLAGNAAFIAAPRTRTQGLDLGGRVFLHNYDHSTDVDGSVLELIMTAPIVVANWINLQYFASTVDNPHFGSGNKTIHNVVGTLGIWQGNSGDLQVGLPLQSLHDGQHWRHEPLRLTVLIEAPRSALNRVIAANQNVRELLDNRWLHLLAIETQTQTKDKAEDKVEEEGVGRIIRYCGDLHWRDADDVMPLPSL